MNERRRLLIFFAVSFIILGIILFYLFRPLINTVLLGFVFTYLLYPLYKWIYGKTKKPRLSSFFVCYIFIFIVTIPVILAINSLVGEVYIVANKVTNPDFIDSVYALECTQNTTFCENVNKFIGVNVIESTLRDLTSTITSSLKNSVGKILLAIPQFILSVFIIIFMMYYLLIDGKSFIDHLYKIIPISKEHKMKVLNQTNRVLGGILYGSILVAAIQGFLGGIGFWIFGLKGPILWGLITAFVALIPFLGAGIVWFPASLYIIITSILDSDNMGMWKGIGLLFWGAILVSSSDNFIRPLLVSNRSKIHPVLVLFGVIGGILMFGPAGIIIGPLIVGMFIVILNMFYDERKFLFENANKSNASRTASRIRSSNNKNRKKRSKQ
ncbi:AI-2E family transporter [Candidatus Woesearchaeota archaeon]|nr:AI-2E family transporter [Candidatus Woesearchaeota archaeon]